MKKEDLTAQHTPSAIKERLNKDTKPSFMKDFIYGAIDGVVTTFAVVASVAAAGLSSGVVILLGVANLIADGFSMAIGNYLGTKAEKDDLKKTEEEEYRHIEQIPEGEIEEIRQIYAAKGFEGELLEQVVEVITSNKDRWVETMMTDEHGASKQLLSPVTSALVTFFAFLLVGIIPLVCFIIEYFLPQSIPDPFLISSILTGGAFFAIGAVKSFVVESSWLKEGFITLLFGSAAAGIAYSIGILLKPFVGA